MAATLLERIHGSQRATDAIHRSAKQMERLIQDLLDMASIESGHLSVTPAPCAVGALVDEAIESIQPLAAAKSIALESAVAAAAQLSVDCDRLRVMQVFANIIGNAVKFTAARGRVVIRAGVQGDRLVEFAISDTGPGIEPGQLPYVFDRFWQAKETARAGTGLGLAICKGIILQHGGSIWVESNVGVGTTFFFTLPVASPAPPPILGEPSDPQRVPSVYNPPPPPTSAPSA
jgi:signal transduction histidine kinase